jgi:C4-dicarboxylate-specific signal transduction histidine kinase
VVLANIGEISRLVALRDSGVGLTADGMAGVFQAFYSTKPEGMGMGFDAPACLVLDVLTRSQRARFAA